MPVLAHIQVSAVKNYTTWSIRRKCSQLQHQEARHCERGLSCSIPSANEHWARSSSRGGLSTRSIWTYARRRWQMNAFIIYANATLEASRIVHQDVNLSLADVRPCSSLHLLTSAWARQRSSDLTYHHSLVAVCFLFDPCLRASGKGMPRRVSRYWAGAAHHGTRHSLAMFFAPRANGFQPSDRSHVGKIRMKREPYKDSPDAVQSSTKGPNKTTRFAFCWFRVISLLLWRNVRFTCFTCKKGLAQIQYLCTVLLLYITCDGLNWPDHMDQKVVGK